VTVSFSEGLGSMELVS